MSDGVEKVRVKFPMMYFDEEKCKEGLVALERYKLNDSTKKGKEHSHAADSLRTLVDGLEKVTKESLGGKAFGQEYNPDPFMRALEQQGW